MSARRKMMNHSLGSAIQDCIDARGAAGVLSEEGLAALLDHHTYTPIVDHKAPKPAPFIVLEGPDGVGKTTLAQALRSLLEDVGVPTFLWQPSSPLTPFGRIAYELAKAGQEPQLCAEMFARDRHESDLRIYEKRTGELVGGGETRNPKQVIVADRYALSTAVYQYDAASWATTALARTIHQHKETPQPTVTFLLQLPAEELAERLASRGGSVDAVESTQQIQRHAKAYRFIAEEYEAAPAWAEVLRPILGELVVLPSYICHGSVEDRLHYIVLWLYVRGMIESPNMDASTTRDFLLQRMGYASIKSDAET